jgi:transcriptional regulator with XRE-family HTH domain
MDAARRRVELAAELRGLREAAKCTQERAANFLGCKQGKIAKIENAVTNVKPDDLDRLLDLYATPDARRLKVKALAMPLSPGLRLARPPARTAYVDFWTREAMASVVLALHSERIPLPLQSERYLFKLYREVDDSTPMTDLILHRNYRARIFTEPTRSARYRVLLCESAFRRLPGGETPDMVIDQADYLLALTERYERLQLQVVTYKARIPYLDPDFTVLEFEDASAVAYVDSSVDAHLIKTIQRVADRKAYWNRVQREALSVDDSKKYLSTLIASANAELGGG